jgi:hypothetical protein
MDAHEQSITAIAPSVAACAAATGSTIERRMADMGFHIVLLPIFLLSLSIAMRRILNIAVVWGNQAWWPAEYRLHSLIATRNASGSLFESVSS